MTTLESIVAGKNVSKETALGISNALEIEPEELFDVIGTDKTLSPKTLLHYHRCLSASYHTCCPDLPGMKLFSIFPDGLPILVCGLH